MGLMTKYCVHIPVTTQCHALQKNIWILEGQKF